MEQVYLQTQKIKGAKERARLRDGNGLWLNVSKSGKKTWVFRWATGGKAREIELGSYPSISLLRAREISSDCREMVANGLDPKLARIIHRAFMILSGREELAGLTAVI